MAMPQVAPHRALPVRRIARTVAGVMVTLLATATLATACAPTEDWTDPEWIARQMRLGDDRAFDEFTRLTEDQQRELVPVLNEVYAENLKQRECLRSLLMVSDPRAESTFTDALERSDDAIAAMGARGLASIDATEQAGAVAERLTQVTTPEQFGPFMEALVQMPTAGALETVAGVLLRPAGRIGGIETVRSGCRLLGSMDTVSESVIEALVFSLVNFVPSPYADAINECELALLNHSDAVGDDLVALFNSDNSRVEDLLRANNYPPVTGQVRASLVMSHIHSDVTLAGFRAWYGEDQTVPRDQLADMNMQEQMEWYNTHGQLFDVTTMGLAYSGTEADRQTLLQLESVSTPESETGPTLLDNFSDWFTLSDGAEVGLRTAVHEALFMVGNEADRELLWQRAEAGTIGRGGVMTDVMLRVNALHYLGRAARPGEMPRYEQVLAAQGDTFRHEFTPLRAYFVLADQCQEDIACYSTAISDGAAVLADPSIQIVLTENENEQVTQMVQMGVNSVIPMGGVWQLAVRIGTTEAGQALVDNLGVDNMPVRMMLGEALLVVDNLPATTPDAIDALLAAEADVRGVDMMREFRQAIRIAKSVRF